ncbi:MULTISPECIES: sigma-70 family RNA polymerase sigma factor [Sporosarcina]|uniref:RNA polymerase, sigma subunit, SigV n=1 Tax=Sporosarcina newyorkensis TaxID=759851 RepID=A0A1T4Y8B8_9BACL|nr:MULTISPECIES: sigma-70 family RNA polymerase sigma factor [Sporosarcina]MBY0223217.1 sigma-70 family RNA polymerase sigma factor [Sporosarcina aquimarina]SKA98072.1 RNA polymerase, sigma subunit, SigV [Sporosarcina newyorkensis]
MNYSKLLKKAQKGNDQAFLTLIDQEKEKLYRIAFTYVKNETDALDIVQETIYKAYTSISSLKEPAYFSTWLTRILINSSLDFIRKNNKVIPIEQESLERIESHQTAFSEDKLDLLNAIDQLEEKYKTAVLLRFYQDLSVKQIAKILECPEGTVKTNLHRAINKLRTTFKEVCINE